MKKCLLIFIACFVLSSSFASDNKLSPRQQKWPFEGIFGTFDKQAVQRGFQVYKEVCAVCHSLDYISFRNLEDIGLTKAELKSLAAEYQVQDGPNDDGEMYERPGKPSDKIPAPYKNEKAARAANNGALPPDLSLIVKARPDGANYLYSLLTGYANAPKGFHLQEGMYYNPYFEGKQIAMPPPLSNGMIEYVDGKKATIGQMSRDVVNFLQWAAEPEMEDRKFMGIKFIIYMLIFTVVFYIAYKRVWADVK